MPRTRHTRILSNHSAPAGSTVRVPLPFGGCGVCVGSSYGALSSASSANSQETFGFQSANMPAGL